MPRPRPCRVCTHPQHAALLAELPYAGLRVLERRYQISRSVLGRHRRLGCPTGKERPTSVAPSGEMDRVITLLAEIKALLERLVRERRREERPSPAVPVPNWNQL